MNYANKIFQDSKTTLSHNTCSLVVAIVQSVANCLAMLLVDRAGRKILVTISAFGCFVSLMGMGLYDLFQIHLIEYNWIPLVTFSGLIFMSSLGILPLTFVLFSFSIFATTSELSHSISKFFYPVLLGLFY